MSWHFSAALEAEFLAENCSDGERFAPWNSLPFALDDSRSAKMKETCHRSPFGTMFVPSTDALGVELLTWFQAAFRARTSLQLERALESTANAPGCGRTWHESLAKYDPDSRSWKTAQCSLLAGLDEFSETWPKWGSMRNGECWERMTAEHLTGATESGFSELWQTPCLPGNGGSHGKAKLKRLLLPTPLASIATHGGPNQRDSSGRPGLQMAAMMWPSQRTRGLCGGTGHLQMLQAKLGDEEGREMFNGGQLNPPWVEWLMGWPIGWTALQPLETDKFRQWQQQHSAF